MEIKIDKLTLRWVVNVEYDEDRPGDGGEGWITCGCDICRCGVIYNECVEPIDGNTFTEIVDEVKHSIKVKNTKTGRWNKYFDKNIPNSEDILQKRIDLYCLERLCIHHGMHEKDNYEVISSPGYYGEEIDDVSFNNEIHLKADIFKMLNQKTNLDKIKFILNKEYAWLTDHVEKATDVGIETFSLESLVKNSIEFGRIKNNESRYIYQINDPMMVIGICYAGRVIDGHNRLKEGIFNNLKKAQYICLYDEYKETKNNENSGKRSYL